MIIDFTQTKIEREMEPFNPFEMLALMISQDSDGFESMIKFMKASMYPNLAAGESDEEDQQTSS